MNPSRTLAVLAGLCTVLFGAGLLRLLVGRFELGDVYPPYSSLRTDPLGCRALYDALSAIPDIRTERFVQSTAELPGGRDACLLLPGAQPTLAASPRECADLEGFLASGGRLVIALDLRPGEAQGDALAPGDPDGPPRDSRANPDPAAPPPEVERPAAPSPPTAPRRRAPDNRADSDRPTAVALARHWDYGFERGARGGEQDPPASATLADDTRALPAALPWHSAAGLILRDPRWNTVYAVAGRPVVAERRLGPGTLVLVADSYLLSNEGLRDTVQPGFLSWLVGPSRHVLFDETHFGIERRRGIMLLARQYRLHGVGAALVVLALLVVWQSSGRLVPPPPSPPASDTALTGRDAHGALRDLLRRHLRADHLPAVCVQAWGRTATLPRASLQRRLERLDDRVRAYSAAPRRQRDAVACYRDLCDIVAQKEVLPCKTPPPA